MRIERKRVVGIVGSVRVEDVHTYTAVEGVASAVGRDVRILHCWHVVGVGAVVGVQPFGGSRLSGTGPKAGGPHYLLRLCNEKTISIDTTAAGGNASLMAMED